MDDARAPRKNAAQRARERRLLWTVMLMGAAMFALLSFRLRGEGFAEWWLMLLPAALLLGGTPLLLQLRERVHASPVRAARAADQLWTAAKVGVLLGLAFATWSWVATGVVPWFVLAGVAASFATVWLTRHRKHDPTPE